MAAGLGTRMRSSVPEAPPPVARAPDGRLGGLGRARGGRRPARHRLVPVVRGRIRRRDGRDPGPTPRDGRRRAERTARCSRAEPATCWCSPATRRSSRPACSARSRRPSREWCGGDRALVRARRSGQLRARPAERRRRSRGDRRGCRRDAPSSSRFGRSTRRSTSSVPTGSGRFSIGSSRTTCRGSSTSRTPSRCSSPTAARWPSMLRPIPEEAIGVNTRSSSPRPRRRLRDRINEEHMSAGVTIVDPQTTWIDAEVEIEADAVVHPFTVIRGATQDRRRVRDRPARGRPRCLRR